MTDVDPLKEDTYCVCRFSSRLEEVPGRQEDILRRVRECGFGEKEIFAIRLALQETLTNAVRHGNGCDPKKDVIVRYAVTPETLVVIVRDEGAGFVPAEVPDPTTPERLSLPSGRGIMLLRAYMDEVEYRDQGREVRFAKHRTRSQAGGGDVMTKSPDPRPQIERRRVFFSGHVQGVCFRYTTQAVAERHDVVGFVRNLSDGRVELVAEGVPDELDRFVQAVEKAMSGYIDEMEASQPHATGEFTSFSIRH